MAMNGRAHLRRVLIKELIGGILHDTELAGFREKCVEAAVKGNQVLNLIAVEGKELTTAPGKECVLDLGQQQTAERCGVLAQSALVQIRMIQ